MKTINIMGTCCSRFIFNYAPINEKFQVKRYAFQSGIWSCFDKSIGLDLDVNDIEKIDIAPFTRRMVNYDFNNITLSEMEANPSDYLMIDLMILPLPLFKLKYKDRISYTHNISLGSVVLPKMVSMPEFEGLTYEKMSIEDMPEEIIKERLDAFCEWALNKYPVNHIIIYRPKRGSKYILASNKELMQFDDSEIKKFHHYDEIVKKYTDYLMSKLFNAIYFECEDDIIAYDENCGDRKPAAYHYQAESYTQQGKDLLALIPPEDLEEKQIVKSAPSIATDSGKSVSSESSDEEMDLDDFFEEDEDDFETLSEAEKRKYKKALRRAKMKPTILKWTIFIMLFILLAMKILSMVKKL